MMAMLNRFLDILKISCLFLALIGCERNIPDENTLFEQKLKR